MLASVGCAGNASVHMIPVSSRKISMTGALVVRIDPNKCYFWLSEQGEICIAMGRAKRSILGSAFDREFALSLVLEGLPAGWGRQYRVDRKTLRVRRDAGFTHTRAASLSGLAAVYDYGEKQLRGRFRIAAKQQSYSVLTGWAGDRSVLYVGEFRAIRDRAAGEKILAWTAEGKMARAPPTDQPEKTKAAPRPARSSP